MTAEEPIKNRSRQSRKGGAPRPPSADHNLLKLGRQLVERMFAFIRTSRTHQANHPLTMEAAERLVETIREIQSLENEVELAVFLGMLKLNDVWLKTSIAGQSVFQFIINELKERGIGGISFGPLLNAQELVNFITLFNRADLPILEAEMEQAGVASISLTEPSEEEEKGRKAVHDQSITAFSRGLSLYRELLNMVKVSGRLNLKSAKRVVQNMVDLVSKDESVLMALTAFRHYDDYTFKHSMNVCVYGIAFGHQLGLGKKTLANLGMAGFFHDIGKLLVPKEVLTKKAKLSEDEWEEMKRHVTYGAGYLLKSPRLDEVLADSAIVAYEHHLEVCLGGYPKLQKERELDLFSRIISIVDCYDALTNGRAYRPRPFTPIEALKMMLEQKGSKYDEGLLSYFLGLVGVYPVGSVVRLDSGETALVYKISHWSRNPQRPVVKIFADASGKRIPPYLYDLRTREAPGGDFLKSIVQTLDSRRYFSDYREYLDML
jgi:HD-GYP domain-containing protein (c-di-GMP phosphodiesterase class II)